jgi:argininosuccinate lyase
MESREVSKCTLPGYTHLQIAMPSSFECGFRLCKTLIDDINDVECCFENVVDRPLGSLQDMGARSYQPNIHYNRIGFRNKIQFGCRTNESENQKNFGFCYMSSVAATLAKFSMDVYMSQNFDFIGLPAHLTTGSSIMPHKKKP